MKTLKLMIAAVLTLALFAQGAAASADKLKSEIARKLIESAPWEKDDVEVDEIQVNGLDDDVLNRFDEVRVSVPKGMKAIGKVTIFVTLLSGGRELKSVWGSAKIRVYKEAVVALNSLKMNRRITAGDIKLVRVEARDIADAAASVAEVEGMFVKRPISAGSVVKREYIKPERVIKRGDRVVLYINNSKLKIKSAGTASADGYRGGLVSVETASGKEVSGRVAGPGEITVEF